MPTWLQIVLALGGSAIISTIVGILIHKIVDTIDDKKKHIADLEKQAVENEEKRKDREKELAWQQEVRNLIIPVATEITTMKVDIDNVKAILTEDKEATILNMRITMKTLRDKYKEQGYADVGDKAAWQELYTRYAAMGGNHFREYVNQWKDEVENLPFEKPVKDRSKTKA